MDHDEDRTVRNLGIAGKRGRRGAREYDAVRPAIVGDEVWWQEGRPDEGGRVTVMTSGGEGSGPRELLPAPWYARTRVHEYGGMASAGGS